VNFQNPYFDSGRLQIILWSTNLLKMPVLLDKNTRPLPQENFFYLTIARLNHCKCNLKQSNLSPKLFPVNNRLVLSLLIYVVRPLPFVIRYDAND
jgi:hypothetical protein